MVKVPGNSWSIRDFDPGLSPTNNSTDTRPKNTPLRFPFFSRSRSRGIFGKSGIFVRNFPDRQFPRCPTKKCCPPARDSPGIFRGIPPGNFWGFREIFPGSHTNLGFFQWNFPMGFLWIFLGSSLLNDFGTCFALGRLNTIYNIVCIYILNAFQVCFMFCNQFSYNCHEQYFVVFFDVLRRYWGHFGDLLAAFA